MAKLDYAFLAEYAKIENGKLTVIGGSFTRGPSGKDLSFCAAGRVRATVGHEPNELSVRLRPPNDDPELTWATTLSEDTAHARYDDKVAYLFALAVRLRTVPGLYELFISLDGKEVRRLAFEAVEMPDPQDEHAD